MSGIFGSLGDIVGGNIGDASANAWHTMDANTRAAMHNAAAHNQSALDAMVNAATEANMQWQPSPGIRWFQKTNRRWLVEIVR